MLCLCVKLIYFTLYIIFYFIS